MKKSDITNDFVESLDNQASVMLTQEDYQRLIKAEKELLATKKEESK